jgi:hypothetical protein
MLGRLASDASRERATTELTALAARMSVDYPDVYVPGSPLVPALIPVEDALVGKTRPHLYALLGTVGFVLLIACVNVANLLLARGEAPEGHGDPLGASRTRIIRQALTECALHSWFGGILGLAVAGPASGLWDSRPKHPRLEEISVDLPFLDFTVALSIIRRVIFGVVPALRSTRSDAGEVLKEAGRTSGQGRGLARALRARRHRDRARRRHALRRGAHAPLDVKAAGDCRRCRTCMCAYSARIVSRSSTATCSIACMHCREYRPPRSWEICLSRIPTASGQSSSTTRR